ncbi:MAG: hypothetical protein HYU63_00015 [Armatimonadetes bacterium]|nr:hypothetical protein [Armatimonadota bacterium]
MNTINLKLKGLASPYVQEKKYLKDSLQNEAALERHPVGIFLEDLRATAFEVISKDRGFAFRQSVDMVKDLFLKDLPPNLSGMISPKIWSVTRFIQTILDFQLAQSTLMNPDKSWLDKSIDLGHVITDICGIAGIFLPSIPILTITAYLGDIAAVGYHTAGAVESNGLFFTKKNNKSLESSNSSLNSKPDVKETLLKKQAG